MPLELFEDEYGDVRNAKALAAASQLAYLPAEAGAEAFRSEFGMAAQLVSVDNTQAYLATNDNHVVVAFRGSQDPTSLDGLKDWLLTNAMNLLIVPQGKLATEFLAAGVGAKFHQGFVSAITEVWDALFPLVEAEVKAKDRGVWVTGHSLGGALALLAAWLFKQKFVAVHQVYTFGAPMVGNRPTAEAFDREFPGKVFRYVNAPDPVPLLPMMSLVANDFAHCERGVPLGDGAAADLLAYLRASAGEAVAGLIAGDVEEKVWGGIKGKVAAHLLDDYRKRIG
jgi:hypothetical protein